MKEKSLEKNAFELKLLEAIENNCHCNQRDLAKRLGVSLGRLNYCLKALIQKSYVKFENFSQNPSKSGYVYLLTPKGIAEKMRLTRAFLILKQAEYNQLEAEIAHYQSVVSGFPSVHTFTEDENNIGTQKRYVL